MELLDSVIKSQVKEVERIPISKKIEPVLITFFLGQSVHWFSGE